MCPTRSHRNRLTHNILQASTSQTETQHSIAQHRTLHENSQHTSSVRRRSSRPDSTPLSSTAHHSTPHCTSPLVTMASNDSTPSPIEASTPSAVKASTPSEGGTNSDAGPGSGTSVPVAAATDKKKRATKRTKGRNESYAIYAYRVLKELHPSLGASTKAMGIIDSFVSDLFDRIATEAVKLMRYNGKKTLTAREIKTAARLVLPNDLAKYSDCEGVLALSQYKSSMYNKQPEPPSDD